MLALEPNFSAAESCDVGGVGPSPVGVVGPSKVGVVGDHDGDEVAVEVRAFFRAGAQSAEDPVTGSLNAALAQWLLATAR